MSVEMKTDSYYCIHNSAGAMLLLQLLLHGRLKMIRPVAIVSSCRKMNWTRKIESRK